ncbi:MAG: hypothetical protein IH993_07630, partial [Proteobacteria bacterium]|nr:hypothetical protein [Pseudomonadota bacterium]
MTEDHVIVFADADPPMVPLMVGERLARVEALGAFAVHEGRAADAADYEARIAEATAIMIGWDLPVEVMRKAPRLEAISYLGTGAANMIDLAEDQGIEIDVKRFRKQLGIPVVEIQANRKSGISDLKTAIIAASDTRRKSLESPCPEAFQQEVGALEARTHETDSPLARYLIERLLLDTSGYLVTEELAGVDESFIQELEAARTRLAAAGHPVPAVEAVSRYAWVGEILAGVVSRAERTVATFSDRLDRVLTHRLWGTLFFAALMATVFCSIFVVAD